MRWHTRVRLTLTTGALAATAFACGGSNSPTTPTPTPTPTPTSTSNWVTEGARMTDVTSGFPGGVLANPSVFRLNDGRYRMLLSAGGSIRSWITTDGLTLVPEAGVRIANPGLCGHTRAFRLDDGRIRVYCRNSAGILSYISRDEGLTLAPESGLMIANASVGAARLTPGGLVRTKDGRWRMYFADETTVAPPTPMKIFSAVSSDLLTWSVESGVRIGSGATASGSGTHPSAITNPDGTISVYYCRFAYAGSSDSTISAIWVATSSDGLTFTSDVTTGLTPGGDPDIVLMGGTLRVYYNWGDDKGGTLYSGKLVMSSSASQTLAAPAPFAPLAPLAPLGIRPPGSAEVRPGAPDSQLPARSGSGRGGIIR